MEAINNDTIERHQPLQRSDSLSTIASSVAIGNILMQHQAQIHNLDYTHRQSTMVEKPPNLLDRTASMKFDSNKRIHVGDVIYHCYPKNDVEDSNLKRKNSYSSGASENLTVKKSYCENIIKRRIFIMAISISLIVLISVPITYFMLFNDTDNKENPDKWSTDSTTLYTTTPETTSKDNSEIMITREQWGADPPKSELRRLKTPIKRIVIAQTGGNSCLEEQSCKMLVKRIQDEYSDLDDIPYNFLIGGDGKVYEGRGFENEGQHTRSINATEYNSIGICIALIGNFVVNEPNTAQIQILQQFISHHISIEISEDYIFLFQDDLLYAEVKAIQLRETIEGLDRFYPLQKMYRRDDWKAEKSKHQRIFPEPIDWVILTHTVTNQCSTVITCGNIIKSMQNADLSGNFEDIKFNFLIGGDGIVFEGRGWDFKPEHTTEFNSISVGIAVIGNFNEIDPSEGMLQALIKLMKDAEAIGKLTYDYKINGRQDFRHSGPGNAFMRHVRNWCRYGNITDPHSDSCIDF